jgi:putative MATE family efflux protein
MEKMWRMKSSDEKHRNFLLTGNVFKVILVIAFPILLYNLFGYLYVLIDAILVSGIDDVSVSAVFYFNQIKNVISSFGVGIAIGGSVLVAKEYGANNLERARKIANTLMKLAITVSILVIVIIIPTTPLIYKITNTTSDLREAGGMYFIVQVISTGLIAVNNVYIGIEKAKGRTKHIFYLNIISLIIKFIFTFLFLKVLNLGLTYVGIATLISQLFIMVSAFIFSSLKSNPLRINLFEKQTLSRKIAKDIILISLPLVISRFLFSFGKVIFNSLSIKYYDSSVIAALGLAGTVGNFGHSLTTSVTDSESSIISQNLGNKNLKRAFKFVKVTFLIVVIVSIFSISILIMNQDFLINLFNFDNIENFALVKTMFKYEVYSILTCGIGEVCLGCLNGFRYTKASLYVNLARLFVFRLPVLYILYKFFHYGPEAVGMTMLISNISFCLVAILLVIIFYFKNIYKKDFQDYYSI